jgi:hypothetical protein
MATSFGALCTDFYVNSKLGLKMDLPSDRDTVLHLFDRIRAELPVMDRFRRYSDEFALESPRRDGEYQWLALRQRSVRAGHVNPETMDEAFVLHKAILELAPYYLALSPLDVDFFELMFGFDLDCKANHNRIVHEALLQDTPLGSLIDVGSSKPIDLQPLLGMALDERCGLQAFFEVKTRTSMGQIRADRYRTEPISVFLTVRRNGPIDKVDELPAWMSEIRRDAERLATDKLVPHLLTPISRAIIGSV